MSAGAQSTGFGNRSNLSLGSIHSHIDSKQNHKNMSAYGADSYNN